MTNKKSRQARRKNATFKIYSFFFVMLVFWVYVFSMAKLPSIGRLLQKPDMVISNDSRINWPKEGQAALMIDGQYYGQYGNSKSVPTVSLAKMMTALVVLKKYPLSKGEDGPSYTVT